MWETLRDHEARIARLEALCNQYNTSIASLQQLVNALQANNYIKDVVPVSENGLTIGYTITFMHGNPITIYNGKDGNDGHTPIVGVKQDTDGNWYWTIDNDWMLDGNGGKIQANATNGITPLLKIEEDFWWVSYDNGNSWTKLGSAVEEGKSEAMFKEVSQDDKFVYFVLANGQTITIQKSNGLGWEYV
ncbi:MAG: PL29 family lyase N-terminal domain-containing protein [Candidatus Cryptobacteroides sp.]